MQTPHVIHQLRLDIESNVEWDESRLARDGVEWLQRTLFPRLECVLDELSKSNQNLYIEKLELDLGRWGLRDYLTEIPAEFEKQIRIALMPYRTSIPPKVSAMSLPSVAIACQQIMESLCIPLLPKSETERAQALIREVVQAQCVHGDSLPLLDLAQKVIFELAAAFPVLNPRQLATIAYPRLKNAQSPSKNQSNAPQAPTSQGQSIDNAGLVIAAPYLGHLFKMLDLVESGCFKNTECTLHALQILQYIAYGESPTEPSGFLDAILCGLSPESPRGVGEPVSADEKQLVDQMLKSIIQHWQALGSTSVQGLRETFLRHSGWVKKEKESWVLNVHNGPFDMLVDRLPWGISMVKYDWMPEVLKVSWR